MNDIKATRSVAQWGATDIRSVQTSACLSFKVEGEFGSDEGPDV